LRRQQAHSAEISRIDKTGEVLFGSLSAMLCQCRVSEMPVIQPLELEHIGKKTDFTGLIRTMLDHIDFDYQQCRTIVGVL
jgi:hypothetical protein